MKQFLYDHLDSVKDGGRTVWRFEEAMVTSCYPLFDHCYDNYEVEEELRAAGVIKAQNRTGTECCSLLVRFSSRKSGEAFIDRLNAYLAWLYERENNVVDISTARSKDYKKHQKAS